MSRRNRADLEGVETSPDGRYIRFDEKLGSGAYKSVWLAYDTDLGIEVAWNTVDLKRLPEKEKIRLKSETDILKNLNHNCIINFYNSWENAELEQVIFTTEIVTSGTLKQYVSRFKPIKLKVIKKWCRQILQGLSYLHAKNPPIIHRDLKCDNIFINGSTGDIRIGDLGLSTMRNATHAASVLGTPEFMAPELYDEWYTEKVDVYAFGMVVLEMISNEYPYAECTNTAQIFKKVSQGVRPESLNRVQNSSTREFIELCLAKSNVRLAAEDLARHPFLDPRFVDYRERFPIAYDPIVGVSPSTPLVPVMELAAVAEHSQHSLDQLSSYEDENEPPSDQSEVTSLEVILESTVENIARVVLTLDLGNRRKEIKFPFDLESDTAEAVAIEMVKELGLQQSSITKLADGIYATIKEEKEKWQQTKLLLNQNRTLPNMDAFNVPTNPPLNSLISTPATNPLQFPATTLNTPLTPIQPSQAPSQLLSSHAPLSLPSLLPTQSAQASVNQPNVHPTVANVALSANPVLGILSNAGTDTPIIDPFLGGGMHPNADGAAQMPPSEQPFPFHQGPVGLANFPASQPTPNAFSTKPPAQAPLSTMPPFQDELLNPPNPPFSSGSSSTLSAPPSSFARVSYPPSSTTSFASSAPSSLPFAVQQTSSFQSSAPSAPAQNAFFSVSNSSSFIGNAPPLSGVALSVPSSQSSLPFATSSAPVSVPTSQTAIPVPNSVPSSQISPSVPPASLTNGVPKPDAAALDPFPNSSASAPQPLAVQSSPASLPRLTKRRSIDETRASDITSQEGDSPSALSDNASARSAKSAPDQALEMSSFLAGFDVNLLQPNQLGLLKELRAQLDENIRTVGIVPLNRLLVLNDRQLKAQYAAMYREAVNKYKVEVVENLTCWGYPIPPLNLKTQGLGSTRGVPQTNQRSVSHLSRRTRDVISLAHGSSNDLSSMDLGLNAAPASNGSAASNSTSDNPDQIYNRLIQPFVPNDGGIGEAQELKATNMLGLAPPPSTGPSWPPKIDTIDANFWDPNATTTQPSS